MDIFKYKRKRLYIAVVIALSGCIMMVCLPQITMNSARKGMLLWMNAVFPALFPFFICANFLQNIGVTAYLKSGIFPFAMSILSGYPMGAKIIGDLRRQETINEREAKRLFSFCSTSGPAFITGAVGSGMLGSASAGMVIAIAHYTGAMINGLIFSRTYKKSTQQNNRRNEVHSLDVQDAFTDAILMSMKSLGIILAYIIIFMLITDVIELSGVLSYMQSAPQRALLRGIFEMSVGCEAVCECYLSIETKCVLCAFIISWGGLSVIGQSMSMLRGSGVSTGYVIACKLMHGTFAAAIAFALSKFML